MQLTKSFEMKMTNRNRKEANYKQKSVCIGIHDEQDSYFDSFLFKVIFCS